MDRRASVLAAALLLGGGCGGSEVGTAAASALREMLPDGTVALTYAAPVGAPVDTLAPDLRIGHADGAEREMFGQVSALDGLGRRGSPARACLSTRRRWSRSTGRATPALSAFAR